MDNYKFFRSCGLKKKIKLQKKMKVVITMISAMLSYNVKILHIQNTLKVNEKFKLKDFCSEDFDCELPYRCCEGFLTKYCCTNGGYGGRLPRKTRFPNITFPPVHIPNPFPQPIPQPIPIPIPIE